MGQDVLGVLETLGHLLVVAVKSLTQRHDRPLASLVHVRHKPVLRVEQNLGMVLEVNLNNLVGQSEHYRMLGAHPFLDVH